jgi:hypothetical protein
MKLKQFVMLAGHLQKHLVSLAAISRADGLDLVL